MKARPNTSLHELTHRLIPGGAHTYSKGDDQFPANAPKFLERGEGAWVWDEEDKKFLDWAMGLRAVSLGYRYKPVIDAAVEQAWKGSNFSRPAAIETLLAEELVDLIPGAQMVKFAKNGSTVTTAAVKLARAYTNRDLVALCSDHPFFSYDDWAIAPTACNAGIPPALVALTLTFRYNDLVSVERLFAEYPNQIAALIMEPATTEPPSPGFLEGVATLCRANGTVFILDEMITGFRWHLKGAQHYYGVTPDLATFGKGLGNGFSIAALVGRREIMDLGGLSHSGRRVFLISTTHGAENHSLAACRAVLQVFRENGVVEHMWRIGQLLIDGLNSAARDTGVATAFRAYGFPCSPYYACMDSDGKVSLPLRTLFNQEMIRRGVLMPYIAPSFSHSEREVEITVAAARESLQVYAQALESGWEKLLNGPPIKPVFRQFN